MDHQPDGVATESRREALLDVAADLFAVKGYSNTSVRDIASAMGILAGSVYSHVDSKEDLLVEVYVRATRSFASLIEPIANADLPALEKLQTALRAHVFGIIEDRRMLIIWSSEWRQIKPDRQALVVDARNHYLDLWGSMLQQGIEEGVLRPLNISFARMMIMAVPTQVMARWFEEVTSEFQPEEFADLVYDMTVRGLHA